MPMTISWEMKVSLRRGYGGVATQSGEAAPNRREITPH